MEVLCTGVNTRYAAPDLAAALRAAAPAIRRVAQEFIPRMDDRFLVIVLHCPCCSESNWMGLDNAVFVTPFYGIDPEGYVIHQVDLYPPHRTPGQNGEAETLEDFLQAFRQTIERALAQ